MSMSPELDELSTEVIRSTVKAIEGANEMARALLSANPQMGAYVEGHQTVADALVAYCDRRDAVELGNGRPV